MKLIGITGGIGAGKSEILSYMKRHYLCEIYLADEVAHKVKEPGQPCYDKLVALLGTGVLAPDGTIDRCRMAEAIFRDSGLLAQTNSIVHPAVKEYLLERIREARARKDVELFFIEAALLIETGYKEIVDELWYIHASVQIRRERLKRSRGYTGERIEGIMDSQMQEEAFRRECDFTIDNSTALDEAYRQIDERLGAFTWQN